MQRAAAPGPRMAGAGLGRSSWPQLAWKSLLSLAILLSLFVGGPFAWLLSWTLLNPLQATLLIWGGALASVISWNLIEGANPMRASMTALACAAYAALALPSIALSDSSRTVEALGPVAALLFAAQLGRRDLQRALRDWAIVVAVALYTALGVLALSLLATTLGTAVLLLTALLPPLLAEAVILFLRRFSHVSNRLRAGFAVVMSALLGSFSLSLTQFNPTMPLGWALFFDMVAGLLIATGLLLAYFTRPVVDAASGGEAGHTTGGSARRMFVEMSHGPLLVALAFYLPLRLLR